MFTFKTHRYPVDAEADQTFIFQHFINLANNSLINSGYLYD